MERPLDPEPAFPADPREASDEQLVARVRELPSLFEHLMRRHNQRLYRLTRAMLGNADEAEDAVQQAYLSAFAALDGYRRESSFGTWMLRIARNEALTRLRRRAHRAEVELDPESVEESMQRGPTPSPEDAADARRLAALAEQAIDSLPEIYRTVFVLRELEGLDTAETSAALAISEEAVKVRLHRARHKLRESLRAGVDPGAVETFAFLGERCDRIVARVLAAIAAR